jgi:hypothetical protein
LLPSKEDSQGRAQQSRRARASGLRATPVPNPPTLGFSSVAAHRACSGAAFAAAAQAALAATLADPGRCRFFAAERQTNAGRKTRFAPSEKTTVTPSDAVVARAARGVGASARERNERDKRRAGQCTLPSPRRPPDGTRLARASAVHVEPKSLSNEPCPPKPEPPMPLPPTPQHPQGVPPAIDDPQPSRPSPVREPRAPAPPAVAAG